MFIDTTNLEEEKGDFNNEAQYKVQELESLNRSVVKDELMRQLENKLLKID